MHYVDTKHYIRSQPCHTKSHNGLAAVIQHCYRGTTVTPIVLLQQHHLLLVHQRDDQSYRVATQVEHNIVTVEHLIKDPPRKGNNINFSLTPCTKTN